jgi:hypothetical protein
MFLIAGATSVGTKSRGSPRRSEMQLKTDELERDKTFVAA